MAALHPRTTELLAALDTRRAALEAAVAAVPAHLADRRPDDDTWSVAEVLEHLRLAEAGVVRLLEKRGLPARDAGLARETETASVLHTLDHVALEERRQRVPAPALVQPARDVTAAAAFAGLTEVRQRLRAALVALDGWAIGTLSHPHPILGPLDFHQWVLFVAQHEARHTRQVREIAASLAKLR